MILENDIINKGLEFRKYLEKCRANGIKPEKTWENIIVEIGAEVAAETFRKKISTIWNNKNKDERLNDENEVENTLIPNYKESVEIKSDGTQISDKLIQMTAEQSKDKNFLLRSHGFDEKIWEIQSAKSSIWNMYSKLNGKMEMYSSKITVKPRMNVEFSQESINKLFEKIKFNVEKDKNNKYNSQYSPNGKVLEIDLADAHFGMLAWWQESGTSFDIDIAEKLFLTIIEDIVSKVQNFTFSKVYFCFAPDWFHSNSQEGTTVKGTHVSVDGRIQKVFDRGVECLVKIIDRLLTVAPVETFYVSGNHSADTVYSAIKFLQAWYRNNDHVIIDAKPSPRKYRAFGKCLIGWCHGDSEGKRIDGLMAREVPELFGKAIHKEIHASHIHHEKVFPDSTAVTIRHTPTSICPDAWHNEQGYVGTSKKTQSFVWDLDKGLEMIINSNISVDDIR